WLLALSNVYLKSHQHPQADELVGDESDIKCDKEQKAPVHTSFADGFRLGLLVEDVFEAKDQIVNMGRVRGLPKSFLDAPLITAYRIELVNRSREFLMRSGVDVASVAAEDIVARNLEPATLLLYNMYLHKGLQHLKELLPGDNAPSLSSIAEAEVQESKH